MSGDGEYYAIKTSNGTLVTWTVKSEIIPCYQAYVEYLIQQNVIKPEISRIRGLESFEERACRIWMILKESGYKIVQVTRDLDIDGPWQVCYLTEIGEDTQRELFR